MAAPGPAMGKLEPELEQKIRARWEEYGIGIPYLDEAKREQLTLANLREVLPFIWPANLAYLR